MKDSLSNSSNDLVQEWINEGNDYMLKYKHFINLVN